MSFRWVETTDYVGFRLRFFLICQGNAGFAKLLQAEMAKLEEMGLVNEWCLGKEQRLQGG